MITLNILNSNTIFYTIRGEKKVTIKHFPTNDMWVNLLIEAFLQPRHMKCCTIIGLTKKIIINPQVVIAKRGIFNIEMIIWIGNDRIMYLVLKS
jgi:hypothetical protein